MSPFALLVQHSLSPHHRLIQKAVQVQLIDASPSLFQEDVYRRRADWHAAYGAVIASFLGAVHWGLAMVEHGHRGAIASFSISTLRQAEIWNMYIFLNIIFFWTPGVCALWVDKGVRFNFIHAFRSGW